MKKILISGLLLLTSALNVPDEIIFPDFKPKSKFADVSSPFLHYNFWTKHFTEYQDKSDRLIFIIINKLSVANSVENEKHILLDEIMGLALDDLQHGYVDTFYFECDWPGTQEEYQRAKIIDFSVCS